MVQTRVIPIHEAQISLDGVSTTVSSFCHMPFVVIVVVLTV